MELSKKIKTQLKKYGRDNLPKEACGILTKNKKTGKIIFHEIDNVSPAESKWDYVMDPNQYLKVMLTTSLFNKKANNELFALFHTHPHLHSRAVPSAYDKEGAQWKTTYIIYAPHREEMLAWDWDGSSFKNQILDNKKFEGALLQTTNIGDWSPWKNIK